MKDTKIVFGAYAAWNYTREIDDLNRMSDNGWQLTKGGIFSTRYKKNEDVRYRYQIDYNTKIDEMARYIETFREQGWEYINSTFNGWHYFRKLYDPSLPAGEYEIYNDNQSLTEMQGSWKREATRMSILLAIVFILELIYDIRSFRIPTTILCAILFFEAITIGRGAFAMRNPKRSGEDKSKKKNINAFLTVIFIGIVLTLFGVIFRTGGMTSTADSYGAVLGEKTVDMYEMNIKYPDFYHFDINGELGSAATFTLKKADTGKVIFAERVTPDAAGRIKLKKKMNFLMPGKYNWYLSDFAGGKLKINLDVE